MAKEDKPTKTKSGELDIKEISGEKILRSFKIAPGVIAPSLMM